MKLCTVFVLTLITFTSTHIKCHEEFRATACLSAHNELRRLHENTNDVEYSEDLERLASIAATTYERRESTTTDVRPTRILPKRRKRHVLDPNRHIEDWDGEIFYPESLSDINDGRNGEVRIGEGIHKFCCKDPTYCPPQFFHGLHFPPSADGVVKDFYNKQVANYDFETGEKKTSFTQIKQFANIAWQKSTKIGCAQSRTSLNGCVYTVVIYEVEGSVGDPENFKSNIGKLKSTTDGSGQIVLIFLIIFFIVLFIALVVMCYCCRGNIQEKLFKLKIKTDTLKAEQELETDSTSFWWFRLFKPSRKQQRRTTVSRPRNLSVKERPTIELRPNSGPIRTAPAPPRIRGSSNATSLVRYHGISRKPETMAVQDNFGYDEMAYKKSSTQRQKVSREPSLSGKPPPPEVPSKDRPIYGNINPITNLPILPPSKPRQPPPRPTKLFDSQATNNQPRPGWPPSTQSKPVHQPLNSNTKSTWSPSTPTKPSWPLQTNPIEPVNPVNSTPVYPPNNQMKPSVTNKPSFQAQVPRKPLVLTPTKSGPKVPLKPVVSNSPKVQPRPYSSPVTQPKPQPVPRKNTAPIEQTVSKQPILPPLKPLPRPKK